MRADLTLVVSPLVSLMQDQVEALERVAPGRVALVNAQQDAGARCSTKVPASVVYAIHSEPSRSASIATWLNDVPSTARQRG